MASFAAGSDSNILTQCAGGAENNTELQGQKRRPQFDAIGIPIDQSVVKDQRERGPSLSFEADWIERCRYTAEQHVAGKES